MKKLALLALLAVAAPAFAAEGTPINERRALDANGVVTVNNLSGRIEVRAWNRNEVEITGTLGRGSEKLEISGGGARLDIEVRLPRRARDVEDTDLYLKVPEGARLELESVSADLIVAGTRGAVRLTSVSGEIRVDGPMREVRAETVSGDVILDAAASDTRVQSVSGDIRVKRATGVLRAELVSGDLHVAGGNFSGIELEAVSGDIELEIASLADGAEVRIEAVSGDVNLHVPRAMNTDLRLETFSGEIDSDFGKPDGEHPELIAVKLGSGGGRFRVESHSGDIILKGR